MRSLHALLSPALFVGALCGQSLTQITTANWAHQDAKINAAGTHIGYRTGHANLGVATFNSSSDVQIYTSASNTVNSFVWDPNGLSLYFSEGAAVKAISRGGLGLSTLAASVAGTSVALWACDGTYVYGARQDSATGFAYVFRLRTSGGTAADIATVTGTIDEMAIDRTNRFLLINNGTGQPFVPPQIQRLDVSNNSLTLLGTPAYTLNALSWVDAGQTFVAAMRTPSTGSPQVTLFDSTFTATPLTEYGQFHRRTFSNGGNWILCETLSPTGNGITFAVLPRNGGGAVHLDRGAARYVNVGTQIGGLTMDSSETKVVVCAGTASNDPTPQIYGATLDREIQVSPRLQTGSSFSISLPASVGDLGAVAVAYNLAPTTPITLPPLLGEFWLDASPGAMTSVVSGICQGAPITGSWTIPANPGLHGTSLWFQGVRADINLNGSFTHFGRFLVF